MKIKFRKSERIRGFSLVELLIVVTIIGILAAVAIPSYRSYIKKANRVDAQQVMMTIASKQQQYILDARAYTDVLGANGLNIAAGDNKWTCTNVVATGCSNTFYTVTVAVNNAATPPSFTVSAAPTTIQSSDGSMTLTSTGVRSRLVSSVEQGW